MNIQTIFGVILTLIGIVGGLGGMVGFFVSNRSKATIALQNDNINALQQGLAILKTEHTNCEKGLAEQKAQIEILTDTITHADELKELVALSQKQHKEMMQAIAEQHESLTKAIKAVGRRR